MKTTYLYLIESGQFHHPASPLVIAENVGQARIYLRQHDWARCKGKHNQGLWERQSNGTWYYARIKRVEFVGN